MLVDQDLTRCANVCETMLRSDFEVAGRALEVFLKDLCEGASDVAVERQARTLTPGHMYVFRNPML